MKLIRPIARAFLPLYRPARYKAVYGGRGSAKSHDRAAALIERCATVRTDAVCIREVQKSLAQSVKKLLELKITELGLGDFFIVQHDLIKSVHGGVIIFMGMSNTTAESIKSLEGYDIALIEEAQSLSQRSLDLLRPTIRKPGSELWFIWNPRLDTDPVDAFFINDNPPPDSIVVNANYMDNPWLPDVLRMEMEYDKKRDVDKYNHVWLGQYLSLSKARVFNNWRVEDFEAPQGTIFRLGADWGFSVDPSVLVRCYLEGNCLYFDYEAYQLGCEIVNLPELFMQVPDSEKWPITADSARPETISHMQKNGFPRIRSAIKGPRSLEEGVEWMKSYDIIVHPRCKHLIDELSMYKYKEDPLTGNILPVFEDRDNHCIDAARYALEGARRAKPVKAKPEPPPIKRIPTRTSWMNR